MKYGPWRFRHYVIGIILKTQDTILFQIPAPFEIYQES